MNAADRAAIAAEVARRRAARRAAGRAAAVGGALAHALAWKAAWRDAAATLVGAPIALATLAGGAAAVVAGWWVYRRAAPHRETADAGTTTDADAVRAGDLATAEAAVARARELERASVAWPLWGASLLGPLLLVLPTAGGDFERLVTGVWSTVAATHAALLLVSWTTAERLARSADRTLAAPLDASGAITWGLVGGAVCALGQLLGRPVTVLGVGLAAFAGLSYLACARLAVERRALARLSSP